MSGFTVDKVMTALILLLDERQLWFSVANQDGEINTSVFGLTSLPVWLCDGTKSN